MSDFGSNIRGEEGPTGRHGFFWDGDLEHGSQLHRLVVDRDVPHEPDAALAKPRPAGLPTVGGNDAHFEVRFRERLPEAKGLCAEVLYRNHQLSRQLRCLFSDPASIYSRAG
jgi:hypothetical protein